VLAPTLRFSVALPRIRPPVLVSEVVSGSKDIDLSFLRRDLRTEYVMPATMMTKTTRPARPKTAPERGLLAMKEFWFREVADVRVGGGEAKMVCRTVLVVGS
jgi:hypothetical protein